MTVETPVSYAPGSRILVRDEEWLVRSAVPTEHDGTMIKVVGVSEFVRDESATFFTKLDDDVVTLDPAHTLLVNDPSPRFRRSRLYLEAVLRRTPLPRGEQRLAMSDSFLLDPLTYQKRPVELALKAWRPRVLLADVVGLGKTLEIGLALAELIRRGRGERILVVSPQHVLGQFQHEMWTRFAIPLVRLDSVGLERIQQEIPAGRNPFLTFKRVIVSVDTLKNVGKYGHHLEDIRWDVVVIDESHNLITVKTKRNTLARRLAARTDALLLASATPHNGDKHSFAELIRLLDPTAIADVDTYTAKDIQHVYLRRTKVSPEVRDQVGGEWADRGPSLPIRCQATPAEEKVFTELTRSWLPVDGTPSVATGTERRLFPYVLLKAFLSSHVALKQTVGARLKSTGCTDAAERAALERLDTLTTAMVEKDSAKFSGLIEQLKELGVGPGSDVRAVVFSESVPTLKWLSEAVPKALGFTKRGAEEATRLMHGAIADKKQTEFVEEFSLGASPVRLLITGDVASEGVNLHRECHQLIHYDLPWSLIRIEQRNGRIDRYGQLISPEFRALILTSEVDGAKDDRTVAEKLLLREQEAHRSLGSAEAVTGEYLPDREEKRLIQDLLAGKSVEESLDPGPERDVLADLLGMVEDSSLAPDPEMLPRMSLFTSTEALVDEALREAFPSAEDELGLHREEGLLALNVPIDLQQRLSDLPAGYLAARRQGDKVRLRLTFDRGVAQRKLDEARKNSKTAWPDIGYVSDLHPVVEWLVDKALMLFARQQAPVLTADVPYPMFLVQGVYCNRQGQPTVVEWMAIPAQAQDGQIERMDAVLDSAKVGPLMANRGEAGDLTELQGLVKNVVQRARDHLAHSKADWDEQITEPLRAYRARLDRWQQDTLFPETGSSGSGRSKDVARTVDEQKELVERLETSGEPLIRILAVLRGAS